MSDTRKNRYLREELQDKNAIYIRNKNKLNPSPSPHNKLDSKMVKLGETWYSMGHSLEEAEIELQKNISFINGYNHAQTQNIVNDQLYNLGVEYFQKGIPLSSIPTNYTNKEYFIRGYNEALRLSLNEKNKRSGR